MIRTVISPLASERRTAAATAIGELAAGVDVIIVGATRSAADDLARDVARRRRATAGLHRFSLTQLAARLAAPVLAARGWSPTSTLGSEAVAARAAFEAVRSGSLNYFSPIADAPGLPRALARTLGELRSAHIGPEALRRLPRSGGDLATLLEHADAQRDRVRSVDRAGLFQTAIEGLDAGAAGLSNHPIVLLDIAIDSPAEQEFVAALLAQAPFALITVPGGDDPTIRALEAMGHGPRSAPDAPSPAPSGGPPESDVSSLARLRRYLFSEEEPPLADLGQDVRIFSSPGESREAVDVARFALEEARGGVRFDEMAVLVRSTREYVSLLEHACARAEIPAWFDHGTRRPHPAGRALLALLACADEDLSARRFAEYLSLAQVPTSASSGNLQAASKEQQLARGSQLPAVGDQRAPGRVVAHGVRPTPPVGTDRVGPTQMSLFDLPLVAADESLAPTQADDPVADLAREEGEPARDPMPDPDAPASEGTLKAPWRWEDLIIESHVIAGRARWRRLDGLAHEYELRLAELAREGEGEESSRVRAVRRDLDHLQHLRAFALPIVDELASWPAEANWNDWLDRLEALVPRVIRQPVNVLRVLADLRPMGDIGPVSLREVRDVLSERLRSLSVAPPAHSYGRMFVGTPEAARGRAFRVVFIPGLAERMFPQRLRDDPMLDDNLRDGLGDGLIRRKDRVARERLRLLLAVGAATERVYLSYPRLELREARPRVPSFYALDVVRAATGRVPSHERLEAEAAAATGSTLAWPAPQQPRHAVDVIEHDLAVLKPLLQSADLPSVKGRAHYLLGLNASLYRSVTERWLRHRARWTEADGIVRVTEATRPVLETERLTARPYSLSALQRYATCPYQFLLGSIYRLEPFEQPEPLQRLDPLTKGGLFHEVQAAFYRALKSRQALPIRQATLVSALALLDEILQRVADEQRESLAPAVERVWQAEIAGLGRDLRRWVELQAEQNGDWIPDRFEFSFGLADEGRDPSSVREPVTVADRFILRGSVDLIERHVSQPVLRVTDHKTGKYRATPNLQIGGGTMLQPVLYSIAVEQILKQRVVHGRFWYCTSDGGFKDHPVELTDIARKHGIVALEIIDRAVELGFLAAAPRKDACTWCDFQPVCGSREEQRFAKKERKQLVGDLLALRELP